MPNHLSMMFLMPKVSRPSGLHAYTPTLEGVRVPSFIYEGQWSILTVLEHLPEEELSVQGW